MTAPTQDTSPEHSQSGPREAPQVADLRAAQTRENDRSAHRRHHWLYEDLLA